MAEVVTTFSPSHPELSGVDRLAAETPRQIGNTHTIFNIANTLIFIGLAGQFARIVEWLVPDRPIEEVALSKPKYLDEVLLETPSFALGAVRHEIGHMGNRIEEMLESILPAILSGDRETLSAAAAMDDEVDALQVHVVTYLGKISQKTLSEHQTHELLGLIEVANDLENIGDVIETDLVRFGNQRIDAGLTISDQTRNLLIQLHEIASKMTRLATDAVKEIDIEAANEVIAMKEDISELTKMVAIHQAERLIDDEPNRLACYTIEVDIIEKLKRIYYFAKRMSKSVLSEIPTEELEGLALER